MRRRTRAARHVVPLLLLIGAGWLAFGRSPTARALVRDVRDRFDPRPARRLLILGNSRTFFHDMPDVVRDMADATGDRHRVLSRQAGSTGMSLQRFCQVTAV